MGVGDGHMVPGKTVKQSRPLIFLLVLGDEPRALYMLSKLSSCIPRLLKKCYVETGAH